MKKSLLVIMFIFAIIWFPRINWTQNLVVKTNFYLNSLEEGSLIFSVDVSGIYRVYTTSKLGASLKVISRTSGLLTNSGIPGEKDANIFLYLPKGEYKLSTVGVNITNYEVGVSVERIESQVIDDTLNEETITNIKVSSKNPISVEIKVVSTGEKELLIDAIGNSPLDMVILKDNVWKMDIDIYNSKYEIEAGVGFYITTFYGILPKGVYRVIVFGGEGQKNNEIFVKVGAEKIFSQARFRDTLDNSGIKRYIIKENNINVCHLHTFDKDYYKLYFSSDYNPSKLEDSYAQKITPENKLPETKITINNQRGIITLIGKPNKSFIISFIERSTKYISGLEGEFLISSLPESLPEDSINISGILVDQYNNIISSDVVSIGQGKYYYKHFNLLGSTEILFLIEKDGLYKIEFEGTKAKGYLTEFPRSYKSREVEIKNSEKLLLRSGFYRLSISPEKPGYFALKIVPAELVEILPKNYEESPYNSFMFTVNLKRNNYYNLIYNNMYGVDIGISIKEVPIDLRKGLTVILNPSKTFQIKCKVEEKSELIIKSTFPSKFRVFIDDKEQKLITTGVHTLKIVNEGTNLDFIYLYALPAVDTKSLIKEIPKVEYISEGTYYLNLKGGERKDFWLKVEKSGLYSIKTSGLVRTSLELRSTLGNLQKASQNFYAYNSIINAILEKGTYWLILQTPGESQGETKLIVERKDLKYIGILKTGSFVEELKENEAKYFSLNIEENGMYRILSLGTTRKYPYRIEDANGFPLSEKGNFEDETTLYLKNMEYRFILLPYHLSSKRFIGIYKEKPKEGVVIPRKGEVMELELNKEVNLIWIETNDQSGRIPDVFSFYLPANAFIGFSLSTDMFAKIYRLENNQKNLLFEYYPENTAVNYTYLKGGKYTLEIFCKRNANYVPYSLSVSTPFLLENTRISSPNGEIPVSVGEDGIYQIYSTGTVDLKATLLKDNEKISSDDIGIDWNFSITTPLKKGIYTLKVEKIADSIYEHSEVGLKKIKQNPPIKVERDFNQTLKVKDEAITLEPSFENSFIQIELVSPDYVNLRITSKKLEKTFSDKNIRKLLYIASGDNVKLQVLPTKSGEQLINVSIKLLKPQVIEIGKEIVTKEDICFVLSGDYIGSVNIVSKEEIKLFYVNQDNETKVFEEVEGKEFILPKLSSRLVIFTPKTDVHLLDKQISFSPEKTYKLLLKPGMMLVIPNNQPAVLFANTPTLFPLALVGRKEEPLGKALVNRLSSTELLNSLAISLKGENFLLKNPHEIELQTSFVLLPIKFNYKGKISNTQINGRLKPKEGEIFDIEKANFIKVSIDKGIGIVLETPDGITSFHSSNTKKEFLFYNPKKIYILNFSQQTSIYKIEPINNVQQEIQDDYIVRGKKDFKLILDSKNSKTRINTKGKVILYVVNEDGEAKEISDSTYDLGVGVYYIVGRTLEDNSKVWVSQGPDDFISRFGKIPEKTKEINLPIELLPEPYLYSFYLPQTSFLLIKPSTTQPVDYIVLKDNKPISVGEIENYKYILLEKGTYRIGLKGQGKIFLSILTPINLISTEGKEEQFVGETGVAYEFLIDEKRDIGFLGKADDQNIEFLLYNGNGDLIAQGNAIIKNLDKGKYYLVLAGNSIAKVKPTPINLENYKEIITNTIISNFISSLYQITETPKGYSFQGYIYRFEIPTTHEEYEENYYEREEEYQEEGEYEGNEEGNYEEGEYEEGY